MTSSERVPVFSKFIFAISLAIVLSLIPAAQAQSFKVLHSFTGTRAGGDPSNGLIMDTAGNLYGTASTGGVSNNGVVFRINSGKYTETVLHVFKGGQDGSGPQGFLIADATGNLYGTTASGGAYGAGTVFEVTGNKETVLYSFAGNTDGSDPEAGLATDTAGNFYGTTAGGGASGNGTVFRLSPPAKGRTTWTKTVLYSFGTGTDGAIPIGGITLDAAGNLYGTTSAGGAYGLGAVFQLLKGSPWTENILHDFQNADDGAVPYAGLVADQAGNLYGAATEGGNAGGGTIFELSFAGGNWSFTPIYSVPGWGISGSFRNVVLDSAGNIYGTTHCDGEYNSGTVYSLSPSGGTWNYNLLYSFTGGKDGLYSFSSLVVGQGKLYGTTKYGGTKNSGVVFAVTP
jgi:uncharacterized repeat protein (TIGR03803 family)